MEQMRSLAASSIAGSAMSFSDQVGGVPFDPYTYVRDSERAGSWRLRERAADGVAEQARK